MSPEARMQDKARVNKERLKGLATMGCHPSRDEIASEDYWERVWALSAFHVSVCLDGHLCVQGQGECWIDGCPSGWGAGDRGRLTGCSHSLFCCSHLWHTGLPGGEQAALVGRGTNKNNNSTAQKWPSLEGWWQQAQAGGVEGGEKRKESRKIWRGGFEKRNKFTKSYSWFGSCQLAHCQNLNIITLTSSCGLIMISTCTVSYCSSIYTAAICNAPSPRQKPSEAD